MKPKSYLLLSSLLAGALLFTGFAWAKTGEATRVGRTATINFAHETQVGDVMFKPGDYTVRHRVVGSDHFMVFQRTEESPSGGASYDVGKPQQVQCNVESLAAKVSDTTASFEPEGNIDKLTKIEVAGENVQHLF